MRRKILIIGMGNSIHTERWVSLFAKTDFDVYLFSSFSIHFVARPPSYGANVSLFNMDSTLKKYLKAFLRSPFKHLRHCASLNYEAMKASLAPDVRKQETKALVALINKHDFALIHTLHTQTSASLLNASIPLLKKPLPKWINTVWGSDIYLHQWINASRCQLQELLPKIDYYWGEGRRDYAIAKSLGFQGKFLPPVAAFGGFDIALLKRIPFTPPSKRKRITVKGYQNVVGRACVAFYALEKCADLLKGYEIDVFSFENTILPTIAAIFSSKHGVKVNLVSDVSYESILKMHAASRLSVALSTSDGLPASFVESMAMGEFPVQSSTSMAYEWANDGETAFLVPPEEPAVIASAIRKALTDDALVDRAAEMNRNKVMGSLDNNVISEKVSSIYRALANGESLEDAGPAPGGKPPAPPEKSGITVSVITIAYKHERFIRQALDGITMQKANFKFELLVGDDHSPDLTASIIAECAELHPDIIQPVLREKNIGALPNLLDLIARSKGKYLAVCDGDDYWTDPLKLQKQVDFLESHPECALCAHPVRQFFDDGSQPDTILDPLKLSSEEAVQRGCLEIDDLIRINTLSSLSVMYRWQMPRKLPAWMGKYKVGDLPMILFHADKGRVGIVPEVMGAYRKHSGGSWWNHNSLESLREYMALLNDINIELGCRHKKAFGSVIAYINAVDIPRLQASQPGRELNPKARNSEDEMGTRNTTSENASEDRLASSQGLPSLSSTCYWQHRARQLVKQIAKSAARICLPKGVVLRLTAFYHLPKTLNDFDAQFMALETKAREITPLSQKLSLLWDIAKYNLSQDKEEVSSDFRKALAFYIAAGHFNTFLENYDPVFSNDKEISGWIQSVKDNFSETVDASIARLGAESIDGLSRFYSSLETAESKDMLLRLVAWRLIGFTKIKLLPDEKVKEEERFYTHISEIAVQDMPPLNDASFSLQCYDMRRYGFSFRCYAIPISLVMNFLRLQYENEIVKVVEGDVVLDCGACWGDTALMFAERCGATGAVYAFEFIDANIGIFRKNMELNPALATRIKLEPRPVAEKSGQKVKLVDNGTASTIFSEAEGNDKFAETLSIDDFMKKEAVKKLDFIKMDIEGAELSALKGAEKSIRLHKPKLAISIYHKPDDLWRIPLLIHSFNSSYRFRIKHNSRSALETVLLAIDAADGSSAGN